MMITEWMGYDRINSKNSHDESYWMNINGEFYIKEHLNGLIRDIWVIFRTSFVFGCQIDFGYWTKTLFFIFEGARRICNKYKHKRHKILEKILSKQSHEGKKTIQIILKKKYKLYSDCGNKFTKNLSSKFHWYPVTSIFKV